MFKGKYIIEYETWVRYKKIQKKNYVTFALISYTYLNVSRIFNVEINTIMLNNYFT